MCAFHVMLVMALYGFLKKLFQSLLSMFYKILPRVRCHKSGADITGCSTAVQYGYIFSIQFQLYLEALIMLMGYREHAGLALQALICSFQLRPYRLSHLEIW